jgi:hypothetical protein
MNREKGSSLSRSLKPLIQIPKELKKFLFKGSALNPLDSTFLYTGQFLDLAFLTLPPLILTSVPEKGTILPSFLLAGILG